MAYLQELLIISSIIASIFWWLQITFSFIVNRKQEHGHVEYKSLPPVSVVIPVYNETQHNLQRTIDSLLHQTGIELEIIVVDDGSIKPVVIDDPRIFLIRLDHNRGKRWAQIVGVKRAKHDWIATIDSDTVLEHTAVKELMATIRTQNVDAATGSVFLSNENANILTRMTACMYWFSFFQERASQSYFGSVMCCSGALSMYRKSLILKYEHDYLNQRFLGYICKSGDDRHLTNLLLLDGYKVGWSLKSKAYTHSPPTITSFMKQQLRWIRSHVASFEYLFRRITEWPAMFAVFTMKLLFRYVYMLVLYFSMIAAMILTGSFKPLWIVLISVMIVTCVKAFIAYIHTANYKFVYLLAYSLFTFFVFNPMVFYGLLTPTKIGWLTRYDKANG